MEIISRPEARAAGLLRYFTGKPCSRGHIAERRVSNHACMVCHRINQAELLKSDPQFRERQKKARERWKSTPDGIAILRALNKAKGLKRCKLKERERMRELQKRKRASDLSYRIKCNVSTQIARFVRKGGVGTSSLLEERCGYTVAELIAHLERQFLPGMTWKNYGRKGWHIDHIVAASKFDLTNQAEFAACWSLGNLRPLWWIDNISKSDKDYFLL